MIPTRGPQNHIPLQVGGAKRRRAVKRTIRHRTTETQDHPHRYAGVPASGGGDMEAPQSGTDVGRG